MYRAVLLIFAPSHTARIAEPLSNDIKYQAAIWIVNI
jgi:hypothetical protein